MKQPYRLTVNDKKYIRVTKHTKISFGISEGQFYRLVGDKDNNWLYMPDLAFVTGVSNTVTAMHRIQQTA